MADHRAPREWRPLTEHTRADAHSLPESYATVEIPAGTGFVRKAFAFAGPGYLVAVGYMDPGNWATDIAGGARFGYVLLSVVLISNFMAILLQSLAARLGIASGRDLAQSCRDHYSRPVSNALWVLAEGAIAATDLAEVIGSAIALNLLFGLPIALGVCLTSLDVLIVLFVQQHKFRIVEALVEGEHCVNELTDLLDIDASTTSRHLAILRNAGLISDEKRGACVYYRLQCTCVLTFIECVESVISRRADVDAGVPFEPAPSCRS